MKRLALVFAACLALAFGIAAPDARASVSIAVTFDRLVAQSTAVAVVTPIEEHSVWENGRIYTYTRVHADSVIAGATGGAESWIRTMGGVVGNVGQSVDGEAVLTVGRQTLLFLQPAFAAPTPAAPATSIAGVFEVSARGQGQFAVVLDEQKQPRLHRSSSAGAVLPPRLAQGPVAPPVLAADVIHGRAVAEAARDIAAAWSRLHAP